MASPEKRSKKLVKGYSSKDIETRVVKNFLDVIILIEMKKQNSLSAFDAMAFVNQKLDKAMSAGTVYSAMHNLERKGLVKGETEGRKTVYYLTHKGQDAINSLMTDFHEGMGDFVRRFLTL